MRENQLENESVMREYDTSGVVIFDTFVVGGVCENDGCVYYYISVQQKSHADISSNQFTLKKRFSQFDALHKSLKRLDISNLPKLPSKLTSLLSNKTKDNNFIKKRSVLLNKYLQRLATNMRVASTFEFTSFMNQDKVFSVPLTLVARGGSFAASRSLLGDFPPENEEQSSETTSGEIADISIPSTKQMSNHTLFQIFCVKNSPDEDNNEWVSLRRYKDFAELDEQLRHTLQICNPSLLASFPQLPGKSIKLLLNHFDSDFIAERRVLLENYLQELAAIPEILRNDLFLRFINARF